MFGRKKSYEDYLAVEIAVKLYDKLEGNDETPVYEYITEAKRIKDAVMAEKEYTPEKVAVVIASILSTSLDFQYDPHDFQDIAQFIIYRLDHLKSMHYL